MKKIKPLVRYLSVIAHIPQSSQEITNDNEKKSQKKKYS